MPSHCDHCGAVQPLGLVDVAGAALVLVVDVVETLVVVEVVETLVVVVEEVETLVVEVMSVDEGTALVVLLLTTTGGAPGYVFVSYMLEERFARENLPGPATEVVMLPLSM